MKKADRESRRQRIQAIEQAEAQARCAWCKGPLPKTGVQMRWDDPRMYCSLDCLNDARAIESET